MNDWQVIQVSEEDWKKGFSENCHKIVFNEIKPSYRDRISYALLVTKNDVVHAYVTVRELDDENVYWQFGGVLPQYRKSMTAVKCIETALSWQSARNERIVTYVENTNLPMLRFYLAYGFIIIGVRTLIGKVMVDLIKEF